MNLRNYILLIFTCAGFILCSCEKHKAQVSETTTNNVDPDKYTDSVLSGISQKTKIIKIDPSKENNITSKKGIKFSIPVNAFITKDGMKPKGKVAITITEYHNPTDILVARIPMQYKTKNGAVQMESAGMFTITATAQNEVLQLASGKDIDVQVPSKNSDKNFNLYYFDPAKNAWMQTADSLPTSQNESDLATKKTMVQEPLAIIVSSAAINVEWSAEKAQRRVVDGKTITLVRPDCSYKDKNFNFTVATDNFPELNVYKETTWIGSSDNDEDIVTAAFENDELITASIKERETPLNRYLISFEFKHTKFNAYMKIASTADFCEINEEIYFSYYDSRPVDENKIEQIKTQVKKAKKQDEVYRSFAINNLGLWNCDRLYLLPKKMIVTPRFRSLTTGESYESTTTYMIDKKINSVWTYTNTITLNPDSDNIVLFVNEKGKICYARLNNLSKTHTESELNLIIDVEEMVDKPGSTEELDKLLQQI